MNSTSETPDPKGPKPKEPIRLTFDLSEFFPGDPTQRTLEIAEGDPQWKKARELIRSVIKGSLDK